MVKNKLYTDWDVIHVLNDAWIDLHAPEWKTHGIYKPQELNDVEMNLEVSDNDVIEVGYVYDGNSFSTDRSPDKIQSAELTLELQEAAEKIFIELDKLDRKAIRPLTAISAGMGTPEDMDMLKDIETQKIILRDQL